MKTQKNNGLFIIRIEDSRIGFGSVQLLMPYLKCLALITIATVAKNRNAKDNGASPTDFININFRGLFRGFEGFLVLPPPHDRHWRCQYSNGGDT